MGHSIDRETRLVACPHPFATDRIVRRMPEGLTLAQMLSACGIESRPGVRYRVIVDGEAVRSEGWNRCRPRAGASIAVRAVPAGSGASGKDVMRTVMMLAVIAFTVNPTWGLASYGWFTGLAGTVQTAVQLGVGAAGMLAATALCPPASAASSYASASDTSIEQSPSLSGGSNSMNPYGPIPKVLGVTKVIPPYGARPYTEISGDDQYLRLLFVPGYGPLAVRDLKIGDTDIDDYDDIEIEIRQGYDSDDDVTLFTSDVYEESLNILLSYEASWQQRTTAEDADEISVDVTLPYGCVRFDDAGEKCEREVTLEIQYASTGTSSWSLGISYESVDAQTSAAMAAPGELGDAFGWTTVRYDRVVIDKATGAISVITGTPGYYGVGASPPSVPSTKAKIAKVARYPDEDTIGGNRVTDERDFVELDCHYSTDFAPAATSPASNKIDVAAGELMCGGFEVQEAQASTIRRNYRFSVDPGQYDVRIRRRTADADDDSTIYDQVYWTALRTIRNEAPVQQSGLALVAMRIKASDQLNGMVDQFNCICETICWSWDSSGQEWTIRATNKPADLYGEILFSYGGGNAKALATGRIDWDALADWAEFCESEGYAYNRPVDYRSTVKDLLSEVAAAGRAAPAYRNGKYSIVVDQEQTTPVQHFTPRNSWDFKGAKTFVDLPHAFRVIFANEDEDYEEDERIVYDDGYDEDSAELFEQLELPGVTSSDLAWKHGRYHIACARLRPETYQFYADVEHIVCTRGDPIRVTHDVPLWGSASGRVKSLTVETGNITAVTMDEQMPMEADTSYCIRFRKSDGSSVVCNVDTDPGTPVELTLSTPIAEASGPAVGDLGLFGVVDQESAELLVKSIEPASELTALITAIDASAAVYDADTGTIPDFDTNITRPFDPFNAVGSPTVDKLRSDESVLILNPDGSLTVQVLASFVYNSGFMFFYVDRIEAEYRLADSSGAWAHLEFSNTPTEISIAGVEGGKTYDLRFRYGLSDGRVGAWSYRTAYQVIGMTTAPPDVETFFIQGAVLQWTYTADPPLDFAGFAIRYHNGNLTRAWGSANPAHEGLIAGSTFDAAHLGGKTKTFLVKAVDVAGNVSENAAVIVTALGDALVDNIIFETDFAAAGFPGDITNGSVVGDDIEADDTGTLFWADDGAIFWTGQSAATFWDTVYKALTYEFEHVPDLVDDGSGLPLANPSLLLDYDLQGESPLIRYRVDGESLFWSGDGSRDFWSADASLVWSSAGDWRAWPDKLSGIRRQKYLFQITVFGGHYQGKVEELSAIVDVPDILEYFEDVSILAAGTRLSIAESYIWIKAVSVTLQDDGGDAVSVKIIDKDYENGPLIKAYDSAGDATTAVVDAVVQGY